VNPISFMSLVDKQRFKELLEEITWEMFHLFHVILTVDVLTSRTPPTSLLTTSNDDNAYSIKEIVQGNSEKFLYK